jgi:hypothetical protein
MKRLLLLYVTVLTSLFTHAAQQEQQTTDLYSSYQYDFVDLMPEENWFDSTSFNSTELDLIFEEEEFTFTYDTTEIAPENATNSSTDDSIESSTDDRYDIDLDFGLANQQNHTMESLIQNIFDLLLTMINEQGLNDRNRLKEHITHELTELMNVAKNIDLKLSLLATKKNQNKNGANNDDDADEKETRTVLTNFANMLGSFFNIVSNPEDTSNVAVNLTNMFTNVVNIAMLATKSKKLD